MKSASLITRIKSNNLIKSSLIYTIAGFMLKGINFLVFPIFSRLLTPDDYGIANVFSVWVGFIVVFGSVQLNACIPTAKIKLKNNEYEDLIVTILSYTTILFTILTLILIVFKGVIANFIGINENLVSLMTIQSLFSFVTSLYSTILIQNKEDKKYLIISILSTLLNIVISLILVIAMKEYKYVGKIIGGTISTSIIGFIIYFKMSKFRFFIKKDLLKFAMKISLPIVPHILSHQLLTNSDRIMLNTFVGSESVGIYGFAYNIGMIINIVWGSINNAWVPWYFENMKANNNDKIKEASKSYIMIFTLITILLLLTTPELSKILAPKDYWGGMNIVPLIIFSYFFVFLYSFPINIQFYKEKTNYIPIGTVSSSYYKYIIKLYIYTKIRNVWSNNEYINLIYVIICISSINSQTFIKI